METLESAARVPAALRALLADCLQLALGRTRTAEDCHEVSMLDNTGRPRKATVARNGYCIDVELAVTRALADSARVDGVKTNMGVLLKAAGDAVLTAVNDYCIPPRYTTLFRQRCGDKTVTVKTPTWSAARTLGSWLVTLAAAVLRDAEPVTPLVFPVQQSVFATLALYTQFGHALLRACPPQLFKQRLDYNHYVKTLLATEHSSCMDPEFSNRNYTGVMWYPAPRVDVRSAYMRLPPGVGRILAIRKRVVAAVQWLCRKTAKATQRHANWCEVRREVLIAAGAAGAAGVKEAPEPPLELPPEPEPAPEAEAEAGLRSGREALQLERQRELQPEPAPEEPMELEAAKPELRPAASDAFLATPPPPLPMLAPPKLAPDKVPSTADDDFVCSGLGCDAGAA